MELLEDTTQFDYSVIFTTDYSTITTSVAIWLDDNTGNLSEEARTKAIEAAEASLLSELNLRPHYCDVKVMLDTYEGQIEVGN